MIRVLQGDCLEWLKRSPKYVTIAEQRIDAALCNGARRDPTLRLERG